jgi:putative PIN family toxin of toxin-antitoxin system
MKVVLDTNVLISGLINPIGPPAQILNLMLNKKLLLLYDNRILKEYIEVLNRKKFNFKKEWINPIIDFIKMECELVPSEPIKIDFKDIDDQKFYETALSGNADYLITGNTKHFPVHKIVITPADFLNKYLNHNQ